MALVALAWPLVVSGVISSPTVVIWLYAIAFMQDLALFVLWVVLVMRYSQSAGRGELFEIPLVSRIAGTTIQK